MDGILPQMGLEQIMRRRQPTMAGQVYNYMPSGSKDRNIQAIFMNHFDYNNSQNDLNPLCSSREDVPGLPTEPLRYTLLPV